MQCIALLFERRKTQKNQERITPGKKVILRFASSLFQQDAGASTRGHQDPDGGLGGDFDGFAVRGFAVCPVICACAIGIDRCNPFSARQE